MSQYNPNMIVTIELTAPQHDLLIAIVFAHLKVIGSEEVTKLFGAVMHPKTVKQKEV